MDTMVKPLYMENADLLNCKAKVTKVGKGEVNKKQYQWVQLDQTIFHPKGGGQLSDEGTIDGIKVVYVHKHSLDKERLDLFEIWHCFDENEALPFCEGDNVELVVDGPLRKLYSRMHTGGHLVAEVTRKLYPMLDPFHGNHDPNNGYVRFKMVQDFSSDKEEMKRQIQEEIAKWLDKNFSVEVIQLPGGMRGVQFCQNVMTCGGTHVHHLQEIGDIEIPDISINQKEKIVTVKYRLK